MREETSGQRFLRPSGGRARHRAEHSLARKLLRGVAVVVVLAGALISGVELERYLMTTEHLNVANVEITGYNRCSDATIQALRMDLLGNNLLSIDLAAIEARVRTAEPWIKAVTVRRAFPDAVQIGIAEYDAVARLANGQSLITDDQTVLPSSPPLPSDASLPTVEAEKEALTEEALASAVELIALLERGRDPLIPRLSSIDASNPDDLVLKLRDKSYAIHLGHSELIAKLNRFRNVEPLLAARYNGLETVDLRYDDRVVVAPVTTGSPNPTSNETEG